MASSLKKQAVFGLTVSLVCLVWFLREVDFKRLWELASLMNPGYALLVVLFFGLSMFFRALRWRILMGPLGRFSLGGLFSANLIGFMANNVLPARLGEFVRAYAAKAILGVPAPGALATIVVERLFDGLALCLALFLTIMFVDPSAQAGSFNPVYLRGAGYSLLALFLAVLAVAVAMAIWPGKVLSLLTGLIQKVSPGLARKAGELLLSFSQGLEVLKRGKALPGIIISTILIWGLVLCANIIFLPAVGLPLTVLMGAMALVGENLAGAVPAAPGFVGTFQVAVFWALSLIGAPADSAMAYAILFWAITYFSITIAGLVEMWRRGMSLGGLREKGGELAS